MVIQLTMLAGHLFASLDNLIYPESSAGHSDPKGYRIHKEELLHAVHPKP